MAFLRRGMSVVMQSDPSREAHLETATASALAEGYKQLLVSSTSPLLEEGGSTPKKETDAAAAAPAGRGRRPTNRIDNVMIKWNESSTQKHCAHLQSADLFEGFSPVQKQRQLWKPTLPDAFMSDDGFVLLESSTEGEGLVQKDAAKLKEMHPRTFGLPYLKIAACTGDLLQPNKNTQSPQQPLRVGLILSGGPAPGGHNVISGVYDYIKQRHGESILYGFLAGLDGLFDLRYKVVDDESMHRFRNQGGFDMLWSGRGRVSGREDLEKAVIVCKKLDLHGLIIVGGDGSNSNAALLSEYFAEHLQTCAVIGVPKTIDGDLRNVCVETSFGFDTAAKTYSELIGNLCVDVMTTRRNYHFVRVMGRSASHLVLECALQTRPNLFFVGEEIKENKTSLVKIVDEIVSLVVDRNKQGKRYGVVLIPEGLIEF
eukprot:Lankesteria_metandrocarpae@DN5171_c3_g1_i1.p1